MQSLAAHGRSDEARELFDSMDSRLDEDAVKPGLSCYNALLLSHVRAGEWNDALAVHETMRQSKVTPGPSTIQGLLLASHRIGGKIQVQALLKDLWTAKAKMDRATFQLAMKMLVPGINRKTGDVRQAIRSIGEERTELRTVSLDLIKSMRIAEVEQQRKTTSGLSGEDVQQRRDESWRLAMGSLIEFANTAGSIARQI
jgi:pentatricopeptide repeat protein